MKKLYLYFSLLLVILAYPAISFMLTFVIGSLVKEPSQWIGVIGLLAFLVFTLILHKDIKPRVSFQSINLNLIVFIGVTTVSLYIVCGFIENIGHDLSSGICKNNFTFWRLFFLLCTTPIFEELCCRIIIINRFRKKINEWVLVFVTATYFALIHFGNLGVFISMFLFGAVLARLFVLSGNGTLIIMIHFLYNLTNVLFDSVLRDFTSKVLQFYYTPLHYIFTAILFLILLLYFFKKPSQAISFFIVRDRR